jgi:uncharacterized circularly permuted ATP-grasp superfamily protein
LSRKRALAEKTYLNQGITFTVYSGDEGTERIMPFDLVPRIIPAEEWKLIERGLEQRLRALNLFLHDIYHDQRIVKEGVIPLEIIRTAKHYRPELVDLDVPHDIYIHVCGSDLIRGTDGSYMVLEDNGRCPSGVSYLLRKQAGDEAGFPETFQPPCCSSGWQFAIRRKSARSLCVTSRRLTGIPIQPLWAPTPGIVQFRLFRAFVPCALNGNRNRGEPGSRGERLMR